jgi:hypothetical protein
VLGRFTAFRFVRQQDRESEWKKELLRPHFATWIARAPGSTAGSDFASLTPAAEQV